MDQPKTEEQTVFSTKINVSTYRAMIAYCQAKGLKIWRFIEAAIRAALDKGER